MRRSSENACEERSRDSYRGNLSDPSSLHLYAYCANSPVTFAQKTKATGLKKAAIIAGCTIAGTVVGALAGSKVAKVAKKAAKAVKKKITSAAKTLKATKKTVKKHKTTSKKAVSKTKKVVTNTKVKATASFVISMKNKQSIKHSLTKAAIADITQRAAGGSVETIDEYFIWFILISCNFLLIGVCFEVGGDLTHKESNYLKCSLNNCILNEIRKGLSDGKKQKV